MLTSEEFAAMVKRDQETAAIWFSGPSSGRADVPPTAE